MPSDCYIAIDLKSFYASQECVDRGLDPLTTHLVVADHSRTEKTICLAVSPSLKAQGVPGRPRLFEAIQKVREVNALRRQRAPGRKFTGKSWDAVALEKDPSLEIDFIVAKPRMARYVESSTRINEIYQKFVAPADIHVYSIDEVFIDAAPYLKLYGTTPEEFARKLIYEVLRETGITATAGIGTNLFLCKVAMDIVAKRASPDAFGARIARLDELSYRKLLWDHRPLTDFWRVGPGYSRKLEAHGLFTMGDIARCSLENEALFYKLFGINAELLIDHAWGWEPCTMADIKAYRPAVHSISSGQVLHCPYPWDRARTVVQEMADRLVLDLVEKKLVTDQIVLTVGYDRESLEKPGIDYRGPVTRDHYGRTMPRHGHGTANLEGHTASTRKILEAAQDLFDRIADRALLVRRINITACRVLPEGKAGQHREYCQMDFFSPPPEDREKLEREKRRQQAVLQIQRKYGKNALLRGMNFREGATMRERNGQIGGHKA